MGSPDDRKLQSCATLFETISPAPTVLSESLDRHYAGHRDTRTLALIGASARP